MFDPNKSYSIGVWDMTFYVVDESGNPLVDDEGRVRIFRADNYDYSYIADGLDVDNLREDKSEDYNV